MAASSSAFEQLQRQRENGKFSPDFAETQSNVQLNSSASTSGGSEIGSSNSSDVESKQQDSSSSSDRRSSSQSDTSCETDNQQNELISQQVKLYRLNVKFTFRDQMSSLSPYLETPLTISVLYCGT
jgi:hypothetical protein